MTEIAIVIPLTPEECEEKQRLDALINEKFDAFVEIIRALAIYRDKRLYRVEFPSFDEFLKARYKRLKIKSRQRADQLITHVAIIDELSTQVDVVPPAHERQSRELSRLDDPVARRVAWLRAQVASGQEQPDSTWVKASVNVIELMVVTGGKLDVGNENGELVAFNAAVTKDVYERMQRERGHIADAANKKAGISAYPDSLLDINGKPADILSMVLDKLNAAPPDSIVRVRITK